MNGKQAKKLRKKCGYMAYAIAPTITERDAFGKPHKKCDPLKNKFRELKKAFIKVPWFAKNSLGL